MKSNPRPAARREERMYDSEGWMKVFDTKEALEANEKAKASKPDAKASPSVEKWKKVF